MLIKRISWQQTIALRHAVLWPDQSPEFCSVEGDEEAQHYGAFIDECLVCVASVFFEKGCARLRKFATDTNYQGQGIGSKVLGTILEHLKAQPVEYFWCDARLTAVSFYTRFGLKPEGEPFSKGGVCYVKMRVALDQLKTLNE